ncbi:MAG: ATP synthase F1 subunit gamma [candidate division Zixibacteria bacterium]
MATLKEVLTRIKAVRSTRRITSAMEMVAAAKLRKAQQRVEQAKPYAAKLDEMLTNLASASTGDIQHPFFETREVKNKTLLLVTSDRGLCGSYNSNLMRQADRWLSELGDTKGEMIIFGKKGLEYYRGRECNILEHHIDWEETIDYQAARKVVDHITRRFVLAETDQIDIIYTQFISMGRFKVTKEQFLPVAQTEPGEESSTTRKDYIFEPDPTEIYERLLPYYTTTKLITVLAESFASEQASRMLAMNAATKAAGDMIDALTLQYNKERQGQITKELLEIVSGAEALKG